MVHAIQINIYNNNKWKLTLNERILVVLGFSTFVLSYETTLRVVS